MPQLKADHMGPTDEEEAEIQRQIVEDPDDSAHWGSRTPARPAVEVDPGTRGMVRAGARGKQKGPTKVPVYIRLDADIVEHFRDGGKGWQTRLNDTLREAVIET